MFGVGRRVRTLTGDNRATIRGVYLSVIQSSKVTRQLLSIMRPELTRSLARSGPPKPTLHMPLWGAIHGAPQPSDE